MMLYWSDTYTSNALKKVPDGVSRLFGLILNPMRYRAEEIEFVVASESRSEIEKLIADERVEPYEDRIDGRTWRKTFRKDGPLEWMNPPEDACSIGIVELSRTGWVVVSRPAE